MEVAKHPWLWQRRTGGPWYLRAKVPADLRGIFPKAEVKVSLRTREYREASQCIHEAAAQVQRLFDDYRKHGGPRPKQSSIVRHAKRIVLKYSGEGRLPSDLKSSEEMSAATVRSLLAKHWIKKQTFIEAPVITIGRAARRDHAEIMDTDAEMIAAGGDEIFTLMFLETAALLEDAGFYFHTNEPNALRLGELVLRSEIEALRQRACRLRGDFGRSNFDPLFKQLTDPSEARVLQNFVSNADDRDLLFKLQPWREFLEAKGMKPRQVKQYESDLRCFAAGLKSLGNVKRAELQKLYEQTLSVHAPNTVIKKFSVLRSYWAYLRTHELVSSDLKPFEGLLLPAKRVQNPRRAWTPKVVCHFWHIVRSKSDEPLAQAIRIAAFTGSRIEAVCSLRKTDVFIASDEELAFRFSDKTDAGRRDVPVHSALRPLIETLLDGAASNGGFLIKTSNANQYDDRSAGIGKRFSRLKTEEGFERGYDFHSIRRTVVGLLAKALCPEAVSADIVGHDKPTMTYGLYRDASDIGEKRRWLEKALVYPDIDFMRG